MPRTVQKRKFNASSLAEAIELVQCGKLTVRAAASKFAIPKYEHNFKKMQQYMHYNYCSNTP